MSGDRAPSGNPSGQAGFTIIETLVALSILAGVIVLVQQTLGAGWKAVRRLDAENRAVLVAKARLEQVGTELPVQAGVISGTADGLDWRLDISPHATPDKPGVTERLQAWWVRVEVNGGGTNVALTTIKLGGVKQ
jgi:general secretion pathway protein I